MKKKPVIIFPIRQNIVIRQVTKFVETDRAVNNKRICGQVAVHLFESFERRPDHVGSAMCSAKIEVEQRGMGDVEISEQSPEVRDIAPPQRHDWHE